MVRNEEPMQYRLRERAGAVRVTIIDPKIDPLEEQTVLEGLEFIDVPTALRFIGLHYPNAKEIE